MPRGSFAYRRTLEFLSRGKLHLKNSVKVVTLRYNPVARSSAGLRSVASDYHSIGPQFGLYVLQVFYW